jgi:hypothetical protein
MDGPKIDKAKTTTQQADSKPATDAPKAGAGDPASAGKDKTPGSGSAAAGGSGTDATKPGANGKGTDATKPGVDGKGTDAKGTDAKAGGDGNAGHPSDAPKAGTPDHPSPAGGNGKPGAPDLPGPGPSPGGVGPGAGSDTAKPAGGDKAGTDKDGPKPPGTTPATPDAPKAGGGDQATGDKVTPTQAGGGTPDAPKAGSDNQPAERDKQPATDSATSPSKPEYIPDLGAPEKGRSGMSPREIGRTDLDTVLKNNPALADKIEKMAAVFKLDPGALAATLFAEKEAGTWLKTKGTARSEDLGADDWFNDKSYIKQALRENPGSGLKYGDVKSTGQKWDTSTEKPGGKEKDRGVVSADKSIAVMAAYMKAKELMTDRILANEAKKSGDPARTVGELPADQRLTVMRLAVNGGAGLAARLVNRINEGQDIPRTGGTQSNPNEATRTAVLHTARAIHLDQTVFRRSPDDYR